MLRVMIGLWLAAAIAAGANADESVSGQQEESTSEPQEMVEEEVDAEIRRIEEDVSGEGEVEEFVPKKPLSADKAIALPSDI